MITKLCTLDGYSRRKDRSVTMRLTTYSEQTSEEIRVLDMMFQKSVLIAIKPEETPFLDAELSCLDNVDLDLEDTKKSPSVRLRNVLYVYLEQKLKRTPSHEEFKQFYLSKVESIIETIKDKLI